MPIFFFAKKKKKCTVKCTDLKTPNHTSREREKKEHPRVCECLLFISLETLRSSKGSFEVAFFLIPLLMPDGSLLPAKVMYKTGAF